MHRSIDYGSDQVFMDQIAIFLGGMRIQINFDAPRPPLKPLKPHFSSSFIGDQCAGQRILTIQLDTTSNVVQKLELWSVFAGEKDYIPPRRGFKLKMQQTLAGAACLYHG